MLRYLFGHVGRARANGTVRNRAFAPDNRYVNALSRVFETSPEAVRSVVVTEYSDFAVWHRALAVTRADAIYVRGSGASLLADPRLTLHEYYHVLRQWNTDDLTVRRYIGEWLRQRCRYDRIKYEVHAKDFADRNVALYARILTSAPEPDAWISST